MSENIFAKTVPTDSNSKSDRPEANPLSTEDSVVDFDSNPEYEGRIVLKDWEKILVKYLLLIQLMFTVLSFGICFASIFRKDWYISMSREFYWWYFWFCWFTLASIYHGIHTINDSKMSQPFTCFFLSTFIILAIDLIILTRLFIVEYPPCLLWGNVSVDWEVFILYMTSICRLVCLFPTFGILNFHLNVFNEGWDVAPHHSLVVGYLWKINEVIRYKT